jgi:hypothetical protein
MMAITPSTCGIANLLPIIKSPYSLRKVLLLLLLTTFLSVISLYTFHRGFRRTIQFWRGMAPLILEYKYVNFKADRIDHCSSEELERRLDVYRTSTAPKLVDLILRMGGIYIKLGQGECVKVGRKNKPRNQSWAVFHSLILRYDLRVHVCVQYSDEYHRSRPLAPTIRRCTQAAAKRSPSSLLRRNIQHYSKVDWKIHGGTICTLRRKANRQCQRRPGALGNIASTEDGG